MASPLFHELRKSVQERWRGKTTVEANYASLKARDALMTNMLKPMADNGLDARMIRYAFAYEQATHHRRPPPATP